MYNPSHFQETRVEVMHEAMRAHPLATVVTLGTGGLTANHIPLYLVPKPGTLGLLQGHVARANPFWRDFDSNVEPLVVFQGVETYISPSWYTTKAETGRVVPTWNYIVVHAYGTLRVIEDSDWLWAQLNHLTNHSESTFAAPWHVADAPADFTEKLMRAIVGIELRISRLEGKWKTSQNQPAANQAGVIDALHIQGTDEALEMASHIKTRSKSVGE